MDTKKTKIGFGVISASSMAREHMRGIKFNNNAELRAICDIDIDRAKDAAFEFGVDRYYSDYKEMLKQNDIDAVIVATPDQVHAQQTIDALEAGLHVLCEKPMSPSIQECKEMVKVSERSGKKLMIGQICRYTPGFKLAKKLIDDGTIGELFFVESEYAHDYSNIPGIGNWRIDPINLRQSFLGGGCHAVDLLRWIAGDPNEVTAYSNRKVLQQWPVDDCTIAIMRFPREVIGKVFVSIGCKRNYTMRSVFYGDKGTIIADNTSPSITIFKQQISNKEKVFSDMQEQSIGMSYPVTLNSHNTIDEINDFVDAIINDRNVLTDGIQGASTVIACLAAVESASIGSSVAIKYDLRG